MTQHPARHPTPPTAFLACFAALAAVARCGEESPTECRKPVGWMNERLAVLSEGTDAWRCVAVGDDRGHSPGEFPDLSSLGLATTGAPRFVRAGAAAGGDGSAARPFADLEAALRAPGAAVIVLSRGQHTLRATVTVTDARVIVGAGTDDAGTTVAVARDVAGFLVEGASGALTLAGVHVSYAPTTTRDARRELALQARGGARLVLRGVLVSRSGSVGVLVEGAGTTLDADRVTVRGGAGNGVVMLDGARGVLRRAVAFRNAGVGVYVQRAHLHFLTGLVAGNATAGVQLRDGSDAVGGASSCEAGDPLGSSGSVDCFREVSITCNGIAGLVATGARSLDLRRSVIADTRADTTQQADGLSVLDGARVALDADLRAADGDAQPDLARGTRVLANGRVGVLVSGAGASLDARGVAVTENALGGVIVQRGANLQSLQAARIADNAGVGLALTETTRVTEVRRCEFARTHMATFRTALGTIDVGDGLSMASATGMNLTLSRFDANSRFGILLRGARGAVTDNVGERNGFGIGDYEDAGVTLTNNRVLGAASPPTAPPPITTGL